MLGERKEMISRIACVFGFHTYEKNPIFDKFISGMQTGIGYGCKYCNKYYTQDYIEPILNKCDEINKKPKV
jgi:hypothetical protein